MRNILSDMKNSIKRMKLDGKEAPRKFNTASQKNEDIGDRYFILGAKELDPQGSTNRPKLIYKAVINSKLIEPLIEDNLNKRKNSKNNCVEIENKMQSFYEENKDILNNEEKETFKLINENKIIEGEFFETITSADEIINKKHNICNTNRKSTLADESEKEIVLKTQEIIKTILFSEIKPKMTSYFKKSKIKNKSSTSKAKLKISSKRKLDNSLTSEDEKFSTASKRKKNIR